MLTAMMERFDLAYRVDATDHQDIALVVERLPANAPAQWPAEWQESLTNSDMRELRLTYKLPSPPSRYTLLVHRA
jgi:internalin A